SYRIRLIPIIGFLLAGVLVGPGALGLIRDPALMTRGRALVTSPLLLGSAVAAQGEAGHTGPPEFLLPLTLLLLVSALAAYLSYRIRLIPIIGFLLAGVLVGPGALGLIRDPAL
ncbi:hypothetical protein CTI14_54635, partial [Methylobacterium radiotolerans]